jgi:hypothetical protein
MNPSLPRPWMALVLGALVLVVLLASALAQPAESDLEERVRALETAVAELQTSVARPRPPVTTQDVDGYTFQRLGVLQQSTSGSAEVVGEVVAPETRSHVRMRATLYGLDGAIVGTATFAMDVVAGEPRTFDVLVPGVSLSAHRIASIGMQLE